MDEPPSRPSFPVGDRDEYPPRPRQASRADRRGRSLERVDSEVATTIRLLDRVARARALIDRGISADRLERHARAGRIVRVRRGWYATDDAHPDVVSAVREGGALSCTSALSALGVWTMPDSRLHVRIPRGAQRHSVDSLRIHWSDAPVTGFPMDAPSDALRVMTGCADLRSAVVAVDSILNSRLLTVGEVSDICATTPRGRRIFHLADQRSESGLETLARLALRRLRIGVIPQFRVPGVGRVDLLIGDRLVLELDGQAWHDFEADRARDRALIVRGFVVIRVSYSQVMHEWPLVEEQIVQLVRRREHLWCGPHRALGHVPRPYRAASAHENEPMSTTRG